MSVREKQHKTAQAFLDGRRTGTVEGALACRSANCIHKTLPASLELEPASNEQFADRWKQLRAVTMNEGSKVTTRKLINDPDSHVVVIHNAVSFNTSVGPYEGEVVFFLTMSEDGEVILEVEEFLDSAVITEWWPKLLIHSALHR